MAKTIKNKLSASPIGIFDSGIGGLTVANAIHKILPNEQLIYFGDTAHFPYGEKLNTILRKVSFIDCVALPQTMGVATIYKATKK